MACDGGECGGDGAVVNAEKYERALTEFIQFGPRRGLPVEDRWREVLPEVAPSEFPALKAWCGGVEAVALDLAGEARRERISGEGAVDALARRYPTLSRSLLGRVWNQAMYFSMR